MSDEHRPRAVGVVGAGTMGVGIAYVLAIAGCTTYVVEPDRKQAARVPAVLKEAADAGVALGKLDSAHAAAALDLVRLMSSSGELPTGLHALVETVSENFELKRAVLAELEAKEPLLLATNTSALSIDALARGLRRPQAFLGMHFFNPVWSSRMVEVVRGSATSEATLAEARALVALIQKESIVVRDVPGFATSRLDMIAALEAMRMLEDGVASAEDIDRAMQLAYRHPIGPLRLSDVVGLDVRLDIAQNLEKTYGPRFAAPSILVEKVSRGELGQKRGRGFYDWG